MINKKIIKNLKYIIIIFTFFTSFPIADNVNDVKSIISQVGRQVTNQYFQYPESMRNYHISGASIVELDIDKSGKIKEYNILKSLGGAFDKAIDDGIKEYVNSSKEIYRTSFSYKYRLPIKFEY